MTETGKFGKLMGQTHPKHLRKWDPEPPKATPPKLSATKAKRHYGYTYRSRGYWGKNSRLFQRWFPTERAREQAIGAHERQSITFAKTLSDMSGEERLPREFDFQRVER